jgi:hypothetical protein
MGEALDYWDVMKSGNEEAKKLFLAAPGVFQQLLLLVNQCFGLI